MKEKGVRNFDLVHGLLLVASHAGLAISGHWGFNCLVGGVWIHASLLFGVSSTKRNALFFFLPLYSSRSMEYI